MIYLFVIYSMLSIALIFLAFIWGLHYGSMIKHDKVIEKPNVNPVKIIKKEIEHHREEEKNDKERAIEEINLYNIDNYDGTGIGQKDIPR